MQRRPFIALSWLATAVAATAVGAALLSPGQALAQASAPGWPSQSVRIVVPTGPGSSLDLIVRLMSDKLSARWGQAVVVENKPGAGGMLGLDVAAKATDGHTLAIGFNGPVANAPFLYKKTPYDPAKDLKPIVMTTSQANVLAVNAEKVPARTVAELAAWLKAQAGKANYASLGNGSSAHLTMELFLSEAGAQATHVPFNGSPPAALSVAQGEAHATFMVAPALLPHVQSGKVRLLAVSSGQRIEALKDVPTLAESGFPKVEALAWNGLLGPASLPDATVARINADVNALLATDDVKGALARQGMTVVGGSAADFKRVIDADVARWGPVIRRLGVSLD
ncbi:MAG: tripartite tricarboxylate transporter substrate binding protein [Rubrivivax sp.]|jgi:tripartite-type tricarboxylate transporter receptor subunit TctC|nr:tripartite tricarboxylate transporter substrate binding protein [Rubrivivax sp.]